MQLKLSTDYALRVVMYLAIVGTSVTSRNLSEKLEIPQSLIFKICKQMANNGVLKIATGVQGGFSLLRPAKEISLHQIIDIFEPTVRLNRCLDDNEYCSRRTPVSSPAQKFYTTLQKKFEHELSSVSIQDLLDDTNEDAFLCANPAD